MMQSKSATLGLLLMIVALGCGKPRTASPTAKAPAAVAATGKPTPLPPTQVTEQVAENKPDPDCPDCQKGDASNGPHYFGKPDMPLDDQTLGEVTTSIDGTCEVLENGLKILEKNAKTPDKAAAALVGYRKDHDGEIKKVFEKAFEIKARIKAAGYGQDMPVEVRPHFDERMGKIHARLELMRDTYRDHPDVLEAFGAFFPRAP